jgi:hypothetical protein
MVQIEPSPSPAPVHAPRRAHLARLLTATGLLVALVVLATSIRPMDSAALPDLPRPKPTTYVPPSEDITTSIGSLHSRDYRVEIVGTGVGIRYNVFDDGGNLILERATPEELEQIDPVLDTSSMRATPMGIVIDDEF